MVSMSYNFMSLPGIQNGNSKVSSRTSYTYSRVSGMPCNSFKNVNFLDAQMKDDIFN